MKGLVKMVNYFKNVSNIEELKVEYRRLAKQYHPDMSKSVDTTKIFVEIVAQYDKLFALLKDIKSKDAEKHEVNSDFKTVIDKLIKFSDINVEIVGYWVWVSGNTYNHRQDMTEIGLKWSGSNKKWYWHEGNMSKKVKRATTWDYKVSKYGVTEVQKAKKDEKRRIN
jgi:curved DNA-binding protein CbpA